MTFECSDAKYEISKDGVIHQLQPKPFVYDESYAAIYDSEKYRRESDYLQRLRLSFVSACHGRPVKSLLDSGFGNGAFIDYAKTMIESVSGMDVTDVMVPDGCFKTERLFPVEVCTYFDVLEHIHDLHFVRYIPAETVIISLPYCHYHIAGQEWFESWHHRKANEHVHHFDLNSLTRFMYENDWVRVAWSNLEDSVRRPRDWRQNILTAGFKRK